MTDIDISTLFELAGKTGIGVVIGYALGYAIKKLSKLLLFIAGCIVGVTLWAQSMGFVEVNWDRVAAYLNQTLASMLYSMHSIESTVPLAGFALGLGLGLRS